LIMLMGLANLQSNEPLVGSDGAVLADL
jgi:hypothetical protein